jgi:hypothetical protein
MRELGPRRTRSVSLCEALDRALNTGVVAVGEVKLSLADVDLIYLGLQLVVTSIESGRDPTAITVAPQAGPKPSGRPPHEPEHLLSPSLSPAERGRGCPQDRRGGSGAQGANSPGKSPLGAAPPPPLSSQTVPLSISAFDEKDERVAGALADTKSNREKNGLGQLVLTLVKVIHELLKRQALRRIEGGSLAPAQIEGLGAALMNQAREIERLRRDFGLDDEELNLDLGPLGKLL